MYDIPNLDFTENDSDFSNLDPLPNGEYLAVIKSADVKELKNGKISYIVSYQIIDGDFKNRYASSFFTLHSDNEKECKIGLSQLKNLAKSIDPENPEKFNKLKDAFLIDSIVVIEVDNYTSKAGKTFQSVKKTYHKSRYNKELSPKKSDVDKKEDDYNMDDDIPF